MRAGSGCGGGRYVGYDEKAGSGFQEGTFAAEEISGKFG